MIFPRTLPLLLTIVLQSAPGNGVPLSELNQHLDISNMKLQRAAAECPPTRITNRCPSPFNPPWELQCWDQRLVCTAQAITVDMGTCALCNGRWVPDKLVGPSKN